MIPWFERSSTIGPTQQATGFVFSRSARRAALVLSVVSLFVASVAHSSEISFRRDIRPILSDHCFACHGPDENERQAEVRLDSAEGIQDVVDEDNWQASLIIERLRSNDPEVVMPPPEFHKPLSDVQKQKLEQWVSTGAEYEKHWAFERPQAVDVASHSPDPNPSSDIIDVLVNRVLDEVGLQPNGPANRRTLARRIAFDLTGLPPSVEQVELFAADESPDALENYVDQLLNSPHYGEHMARFWLDVVRYGDTHGLHLDNYREMWPYRDWVIEAFNANMPFDQFITEQLAGDLMPDATKAQQIASGFNRLNVTTSEGGSIYDEVFARNVMDRTDAFGTIFLGLTTGCAVCHDHKFDPITQKDYYSLSAFFNSLDGRALDGNKKDHPPVLQVASEEQEKQQTELKAELVSVEKQLKGSLPSVDQAQLAWEKSLSNAGETVRHVLAPTEVISESGSAIAVGDDNTVTLEGDLPAKDNIQFTATLPTGTWRMLELAALADKDHPKAGTAANQNAVLSEIVIERRTTASSPWLPVPIRAGFASRQQDDNGFAIDKAFDGRVDADTGWAIGGHEADGPRTAWFLLQPVQVDNSEEAAAAEQIRVTLKYQSKFAQHFLRQVKATLFESSTQLPEEHRVSLGDVHVAGPFPIENPNPGYGREFAGEKKSEFDASTPITSGDREFRWQHHGDLLPAIPNQLPVEPDRNTVAVVHQELTSPKKQSVDLLIGTDDGHVVLLNGKQVGQLKGPRKLDPLRQTYSLELQKGVNHLFIKHVRHNADGLLTYAFRSLAVEVPKRFAEKLASATDKRSAVEKKTLRTFYRAAFCDHPDWLALQDSRKGLLKLQEKLKAEIPTTLVWKETEEPRTAHVLQRGQYDSPGEAVDRQTPSFLPPFPEGIAKDRLGLAAWLTSDEHPLTSRVAVNRFWQQLFGAGMVKSSEDFGSQGTPPTHPELLDQLSVDFRSSGWDVKALMKRLVMTQAYQRSAKTTPEMLVVDPKNQYFARGPRYRLDAEMLRDQMLAVSGLLVDKRGGPSVKPPQPKGLWAAVGYTRSDTATFVADLGEKVYRRSVYTFWKRTSSPAVMATFDAPSRESCTARRERTNTPLQALLLLNETQSLEAAKSLAKQALALSSPDSATRITELFHQVVLRPIQSKELVSLETLLTDLTNFYINDLDQAGQLVGMSDADLAAWTVVASTLLNLDEVVCK